MTNLIAILDELRAIAQMGLTYSKNPYEHKHFSRVMELTAAAYAAVTGLPETEINERFRRTLGHFTPLVGCAAAIFNAEGRILLVKNDYDDGWGLPAGFADVNQTPSDNIRREVREETGLEVEVHELIDIFTVLPGNYGQAHTLYTLLYHCAICGGDLTPSFETPETGFYDRRSITKWSNEHEQLVELAYQFWLAQTNPQTNEKRPT